MEDYQKRNANLFWAKELSHYREIDSLPQQKGGITTFTSDGLHVKETRSALGSGCTNPNKSHSYSMCRRHRKTHVCMQASTASMRISFSCPIRCFAGLDVLVLLPNALKPRACTVIDATAWVQATLSTFRAEGAAGFFRGPPLRFLGLGCVPLRVQSTQTWRVQGFCLMSWVDFLVIGYLDPEHKGDPGKISGAEFVLRVGGLAFWLLETHDNIKSQ